MTKPIKRAAVFDLVNETVRHELTQDQEDLQAFNDRVKESTVSYAQLLKELKRGR